MDRYRLFLFAVIALIAIIALNSGGVHDAIKSVIEFYEKSGYF